MVWLIGRGKAKMLGILTVSIWRSSLWGHVIHQLLGYLCVHSVLHMFLKGPFFKNFLFNFATTEQLSINAFFSICSVTLLQWKCAPVPIQSYFLLIFKDYFYSPKLVLLFAHMWAWCSLRTGVPFPFSPPCCWLGSNGFHRIQMGEGWC